MSRALPQPPLSTLPIQQLLILTHFQEDLSDRTPKEWFDRAKHEADLAVIAERKARKEEMFIAYSRCCSAYANTKMHPDFKELRKSDAHWANRIKDFQETYEAYLVKAKEIKESLKNRDVEKGEGSSKPGITRSSSTNGPEVTSIGSIADRMKMLSGKGMDIGPSKKPSRDPLTPLPQPPTSTTTTRVRAPSSTSSKESGEKNASSSKPKGPSVQPKPLSIHQPSKSIDTTASDNKATRSRSNSKAEKPLSPHPSGQSPISPHHSGADKHPPPIAPKPNLNRPRATSLRQASVPPQLKDEPEEMEDEVPEANNTLNNFEKHFPSLTDFGKQFEEEEEQAFKPGPNGLIGPYEHVDPEVEEDDGDDKDDIDMKFPEIPKFPDLPSVPNDLPISKGSLPPPPKPPTLQRLDSNGKGTGPPDAGFQIDISRPASSPNVAALGGDSNMNSTSSSREPLPASLRPGQPPHQALSPPPPTSAPIPSGSSPKPNSQEPLPLPPKPKFPFTNSVDPDTLRSYILHPAIDMLILDVRSEEEYKKGYAGKEYEPKGYHVKAIWIDPTVLMRNDMNSSKLEDSLSLLPDVQQKWFINRDKCDLVIVYDATSTSWPKKGQSPSPLSRIWDIIYDHEFQKKLQRNPEILIGGYEHWTEFVRRRQLRHGGAGEKENANKIPNGHGLPASPRPSDRSVASPLMNGDISKKVHRDLPVYQSSQHTKPYTDQNYQDHSYTGQPSRSYLPQNRHSPSNSLSYPSPLIAPPPQASLHPGPGSRRRSDYVEHHSQAYSGYSSPPPPISGSSRGGGPIDYPSPHALASIPANVSVPQLPPAAQSHQLERYEHRPAVTRSGSLRALEMMAREGDECRYWNDIALGLTGLKNLGNTCYMNSTLQCLSATYPFTSYFLDGSYRKAINLTNPLGTKGHLANAFAELLKALWKEDYTFLSPVTFRKNIIAFASQFSGTDQHDSQEFLSFVLDGLHEDLNRVKVKPPPVEMTPEREARLETLPPEVASEMEWDIYRQRNDSFIVDLFQGQYRNRLECLTCHKTSTTYDTFMYMSLPVPAGKKGVVVQELIDEFISAEILDKDDAWHCPRCKVPRRASKTLSISRLPPLLLIQLKRFSTKNGVFWDKSETPVIFPLKTLDLTRYVPTRRPTGKEDLDDPRCQIGPFKYDLYGVSNHMGTLSSGHYTAFVKSSKGWMHCEDSKIAKAQEKDVVSRPAYILFYKRIRV